MLLQDIRVYIHSSRHSHPHWTLPPALACTLRFALCVVTSVTQATSTSRLLHLVLAAPLRMMMRVRVRVRRVVRSVFSVHADYRSRASELLLACTCCLLHPTPPPGPRRLAVQQRQAAARRSRQGPGTACESPVSVSLTSRSPVAVSGGGSPQITSRPAPPGLSRARAGPSEWSPPAPALC